MIVNSFERNDKMRSRKKTHEEFVEEVYELVGEEYIVIGEYTQAQTSISMKHITCNTEYKVTPDNFLRGERCSECNGGIRKTLEKFKQDVYNIFQDEYSVIGEYTNRNKKILMKHNICGCEFDTTPRDFLNKESKCPNCNKSNAENITRKKLNILDLNFDSEYKFENCINPKTNRKLSFDFAVFVDNIILFELDGQHHFKPVRFGGISMEVALVKFKEQKIRDKIKNKYCKQNNIKLIRIPYWDFDRIEEILDKELKYYKQCASL